MPTELPPPSPAAPLLTLSNVHHTFTLPSGKTLPVLADINVTIFEGELVAILGPSGCGKSTLIRIMAGLVSPTKGEVRYRGEALDGPSPHMALVFQQFALFPWLTVAQNIEQALIPRGIDLPARRKRVAETISLIGLEGFEEAYPRELSGGMRQRVGIARAIAVEPELLCMDEPFSQVDALTAEMLRNEVVRLWRDRAHYPESILMVSHDIQEVAFLASRILIMTANPGRVTAVLENPLPYPRQPYSPSYQALVTRLHDLITGLYMPEQQATVPSIVAAPSGPAGAPAPAIVSVPLVNIRDIVGLVESVYQRGGEVEFFLLTAEMGRTFTRILLAMKAAELLGLLETPDNRLRLTPFGQKVASAPPSTRRPLVAARLADVPLIKRIREMLRHSPEGRLTNEVLFEELAIQCPQEDPKRLLRVLMNWGRYAGFWSSEPVHAALVLIGREGNERSNISAGL